MKVKVKNAKGAKLDAIRSQVRNTLTGEGAAELKAAIMSVIDELENTEVEVDAETLRAEILRVCNENGDVPAAVAESIAKIGERVKAMQNTMPKELSPKVKNEISAAILRAHSKEEVKNAVEKVAKENGVSGLSFNETIDFAVVDNWGDLNPLFAMLKKVRFSKFFYTEQDKADADILAKQWDKNGGITKAIQDVVLEGKTISTRYIYKLQKLANEDLDDINESGEAATLLRWLDEELDRQIANTIVRAILIGDTANPSGQRVTTFETIGSQSADPAFVTPVYSADFNDVGIEAVRAMCDKVHNPHGAKKVLVINPAVMTKISAFVYAAGGSTMYRTEQEIAGMLGVDEIVKTDVLRDIDVSTGSDSVPFAICFLPDEYWVKEKNTIAVSYPKYEENSVVYQKERNIGGAIHGLLSAAALYRDTE